MRNVEFTVGEAFTDCRPLMAYSETAVDFLVALSTRLLRGAEARSYPDVASFAYWCRRSSLYALKGKFPAGVRLGRGIAFHIAPSNIPVNFAFSFAFALLAGNANIVRVPSKSFPQVKIITDAVRATLHGYPDLEHQNAFVSYSSSEEEVTRYFSSIADARIIWGGDRTVGTIRSFPAKPRCVDIAFADRYSVTIIDGEAVLAATEETLGRLANDFYNDTFLMDQNACSSPSIVFWTHDSVPARTRFWEAAAVAAEKKYELQPAVVMDKYLKLCEDLISQPGVADVKRMKNLIYRVSLSELPEDVTALRGRGGYFYEYALANLQELAPYINEKFQTLSYFGLDPQALLQFVMERRLRGIDRIVPVGKAMDIGPHWDGFDLVETLSRLVTAS